MVTQSSLNTSGFEEYLEKIARAGTDIDASADKALMAGAEVIQEEMLRLVPQFTMNLAKHIRIKGPKRDGNYHSVEVGVIHDIAFTDANTARYGNAQEYGTSSMPAHPYIRPTMTTDKRKILQAIKASLFADEVMM